MKTGLVMEGGAMRGMFTAGVLDVMMENDITFDVQLVCLRELFLAAISSQNRLAG